MLADAIKAAAERIRDWFPDESWQPGEPEKVARSLLAAARAAWFLGYPEFGDLPDECPVCHLPYYFLEFHIDDKHPEYSRPI